MASEGTSKAQEWCWFGPPGVKSAACAAGAVCPASTVLILQDVIVQSFWPEHFNEIRLKLTVMITSCWLQRWSRGAAVQQRVKPKKGNLVVTHMCPSDNIANLFWWWIQTLTVKMKDMECGGVLSVPQAVEEPDEHFKCTFVEFFSL